MGIKAWRFFPHATHITDTTTAQHTRHNPQPRMTHDTTTRHGTRPHRTCNGRDDRRPENTQRNHNTEDTMYTMYATDTITTRQAQHAAHTHTQHTHSRHTRHTQHATHATHTTHTTHNTHTTHTHTTHTMHKTQRALAWLYPTRPLEMRGPRRVPTTEAWATAPRGTRGELSPPRPPATSQRP